MKSTPVGKLIAVFLSILLCFGFILSCDGTNAGTTDPDNPSNPNTPDTPSENVVEQQTFPNDPIAIEVEDTSYNWADWTPSEEIPYEAPVDGITINKPQMISIGPGANCST